MKGINIFRAPQAATAICLTMEEASSSSSSPSSTILLGGGSRSPAIDRCNPIITDSRRTAKPLPSSTTPIIPKPHRKKKKKKNQKIPPKEDDGDQAKKTSIDNSNGAVRKSWSSSKPSEFISPPGSTRYLLSEKVLFNALSDFDPTLKVLPAESSNCKAVRGNHEFSDAKPPSSSASPNQVVVLRVSLHCRGCERKMRKHISRMEGVSSFNIDFAAKKVTVTGNITPLEVLSSISKVKNAQLWPPTISSPSNSEFKNESKGNEAFVMDNGIFVGITS